MSLNLVEQEIFGRYIAGLFKNVNVISWPESWFGGCLELLLFVCKISRTFCWRNVVLATLNYLQKFKMKTFTCFGDSKNFLRKKWKSKPKLLTSENVDKIWTSITPWAKENSQLTCSIGQRKLVKHSFWDVNKLSYPISCMRLSEFFGNSWPQKEVEQQAIWILSRLIIWLHWTPSGPNLCCGADHILCRISSIKNEKFATMFMDIMNIML